MTIRTSTFAINKQIKYAVYHSLFFSMSESRDIFGKNYFGPACYQLVSTTAIIRAKCDVDFKSSHNVVIYDRTGVRSIADIIERIREFGTIDEQ